MAESRVAAILEGGEKAAKRAREARFASRMGLSCYCQLHFDMQLSVEFRCEGLCIGAPWGTHTPSLRPHARRGGNDEQDISLFAGVLCPDRSLRAERPGQS